MYKFAINKPIATLMMVMSFLVFGLISYKTMPVNLFPNVEFPIITIQTAYYGEDPQSVESKVTDKIEEAISGIDGIDKILSTSYEGLSVVTVVFDLERDITEAANDVRDKIGGIVLAREVEKPSVKKVSGTSGAVINLFIATKNGNLKGLMRLADEKIKAKLQRIRGVGEINIIGYRDREVRIFVDPFLLNKYNLTAQDLQNIIRTENIRKGGGKLIGKNSEYTLKAKADASSIEDMKNLRILPGIKLKDIAKVQDGLSDAKSFSSFNGKQGIMIEVKKIAGTNTLNIIKGVKDIMPELKIIAGSNYELKLLKDQSDKIMQSINQVTFDLIFGALLAIIIVFFFLRNFTATFVSALAIPISIIGTFAVIDWLGYDLNRLTLIGLTLAIGIFIDDAIVVIENITKKMEKGIKPFQASFEGIKEISFSILAISAMLLAVFIPVAFMDGIVGKFFNSFAITIASGVVISYIVAIMFIPMVGARVLSEKQSKFFHLTEPFFVKIDKIYCSILKPLIKFKTLTIIASMLILLASGTLLKKIGGDFVPMEDNSEMRIIVKAPIGINLETMKKRMLPITKELAKDKKIEYTLLSIGYTASKEIHKAKLYVKLVPVEQRKLRQEEIVDEYRKKLSHINGLKISVEEVPTMDTGLENAKIQIVLRGPNLDILEKKSLIISKKLASINGPVDVDTDYEKGKPEIKITIKRENAKRWGVSAQEIAGILGATFSSDLSISNYEENGKQFNVTLRFSDANRKTINDLKKLQIRTSSGNFIPLEGLINFEEDLCAVAINRFDRERKILVKANLSGAPLNSIVENMNQKLNKVLKDGYTFKFTGDIQRMKDTATAFAMAVGLAVILIYLILAALYESLIQPLIIMVAMPLSFTGVLLGLYLANMPFSLFVMLGVILLLGMVGKNAILVVDFANNAIKKGKNIDEALLEAGEKRLRPILMTTFAMIGAMMPLAFGTGAGHEGNAPMAISIIGGLISSTILTLLVVPAIYKFMYPLDRWLRKFYEKDFVE